MPERVMVGTSPAGSPVPWFNAAFRFVSFSVTLLCSQFLCVITTSILATIMRKADLSLLLQASAGATVPQAVNLN